MGWILFFTNNATPADCAFQSSMFGRLRKQGIGVLAQGARELENCVNAWPMFQAGETASAPSQSGPLGAEDLEIALERSALYRRGLTAEDLQHTARSQDRLMALARPRCVLVWNDIWPEHTIAVRLAQRRNIPVMVIERTPWPGLVSLDPEGFMSNAAFARRDASNGGKADAAEEIFAEIERGALTWWPTGAQTDAPVSTEPAPALAGQTVLFLEQLDSDANAALWGGAYKKNHLAQAAVGSAVANLPDATLLVRRHPKSRLSNEEYLQGVEGQVELAPDEPVQASLRRADAVVAVNSSALYEAVIHGTPAVSLGQTLLDGGEVFFEAPRMGVEAALAAALGAPAGELSARRARMAQRVQGLMGSALYPCRPPRVEDGARACADAVAAACRPARISRTLGGAAVAAYCRLQDRMWTLRRRVRPRLRAVEDAGE